jgi:hypothetical protein
MVTPLSVNEMDELIAAGDAVIFGDLFTANSESTSAMVENSYDIKQAGTHDTIYSHLHKLKKWTRLVKDPTYSGSLKMIMDAYSKDMPRLMVITGKDGAGREALMGFINNNKFISQCSHTSDRMIQAYPIDRSEEASSLLRCAGELISERISPIIKAVTGGVFFTERSPVVVRYSVSNPGSITMKIVGMMSITDGEAAVTYSWADYDSAALSIPAVVGRVHTSVSNLKAHDNLFPTLSELTLSMAHRLATDSEYYARRRDGIIRQGLNEKKYKAALAQCKIMYEALHSRWGGNRKYIDSVLVDMQKAVEDNGVPKFNEKGGFYKYTGTEATLKLTSGSLDRNYSLSISVTSSPSGYTWYGVVNSDDITTTIVSLAAEFGIQTGEFGEFDLSGLFGHDVNLGSFKDPLFTAVLLQLVRYILKHDATASLMVGNQSSLVPVSMLESIALDGPIRFRSTNDSNSEEDVAKAITNLLQGLKAGSNYEPRITGSHGAGAPAKFRYNVTSHAVMPLSLYDALMSIYCHLRIHSCLPSWIADLESRSNVSEVISQIRSRVTLMNGTGAPDLAKATFAMVCNRRKIATTLASLE